MPRLSLRPGWLKTWALRRRQPRTQFQPSVDGMEPRLLMSNLPRGFAQVVVARRLGKPSGMVAAPDGRLFVIQQTGEVRVIQNGKLLPTPALKVATDPIGERGLVGITLDPNFASNSYIYLYYTVPGSPDHNRVSRFTLSGNAVVPGSEVPLLDLPGLGTTGHNGGSLQFGADGKLYVGVGDNEVAAERTIAVDPARQDPPDQPGRDDPHGQSVLQPDDGNQPGHLGHGAAKSVLDGGPAGDGTLYINDVGQDTWEKIDKGVAGANYGWPITENAKGDARFQNPLYVYNHGVNDSNGAAITAGTFYDPARAQFPRAYVGRYFFGDIKGWIKVYNPANGRVTGFATKLPTVLDALAVDPSGNLYVLSRGNGPNTGTPAENPVPPALIRPVSPALPVHAG